MRNVFGDNLFAEELTLESVLGVDVQVRHNELEQLEGEFLFSGLLVDVQFGREGVYFQEAPYQELHIMVYSIAYPM